MIQKYIQYLRLIGLGKGRIFLHILIHVLDGVREFVVNIFAVSFYISCLQEGDGKRFFAGLLFFCGINLALRGVSRWYRECYSEQADILQEGLFVRQRRERKKLNQEDEIRRLLELVGLSYDFAGRFPHELSGGQLQRICIARAVACNPELILFDEAISSLDAHTQVQIMDLLLDLKEKLGLTYIFITHDLTSITYLCDDVLFLYQGRVTEYLPVKQLSEAKDIYARKLLESIIVFDTEEAS